MNEVNILSPMATVSANKNYVTVLSIPDESSSSQTLFSDLNISGSKRHPSPMYHKYVPSYTSNSPEMRPSCSKNLDDHKRMKKRNDSIVEVNGDNILKTNGLHVVGASPKQHRRIEFDETASRSRAKSYHETRTGSPKTTDQFKRIHKSGYFGGLPDSFVDDFDDLMPDMVGNSVRAQRIVLSQDGYGVETGISVTEVHDPKNSGRLAAVEVYRIEENQRIAIDGQLQVGDRIIKINNRPVYQMSLTAARLYIDELKREEEPSIVFYRLSKVDSTKKDVNMEIKPVKVMVQQGNTAALHNLKSIPMTKSNQGFGFRFASRKSERGNIFLITYVVPNGPSDELLFSGDRLIKIDDRDLSDLVQSEVTDLIKSCPIGTTLIFQVSRTEDAEESVENISTSMQSTSDEINGLETDDQLLEFHIPVNETAAAGLGLVLKGRHVNENAAVFIDRILRGSAAYKDGRLREGDRILGIENLNLLQFTRNSEAAQAFNSYVSSLPSSCAYFRIFISRKLDSDQNRMNIMKRKDFIAWMNDSKNDLVQTNEKTAGSIQNRTNMVGSSRSSTNSQEEDTTKTQPTSQKDFADDATSITSIQQIDPFNRESASRKSFSEKGPSGMRVNPTKFENFKQISHQRQISAPTIGHRKHRAQFRRQRSAVILKNKNEQTNLESSRLDSTTDPTKQKGFSFLSFFGLRNSSKTTADKENVDVRSEEAQNAKGRSMSEEPFKVGETLAKANNQEKDETLPTDLSSPSNAASREALRKKRRSVGTSMLKFFQRTDSPPKTSNGDENVESRKLSVDVGGEIYRKPSSSVKNQVSPQLRPLSVFQHRRFNSAHDGLKYGGWSSPTQQQNDDMPESRQLGTIGSKTSPNKQSRRKTHASTHSFKQPSNEYRPSYSAGAPVYIQSGQAPDYYEVFNQWFAATGNQAPINSINANPVPFHPSASSTSPSTYRNRAANPPAYPTNKPYPTGLPSSHLQPRHPPTYYVPGSNCWPSAFYPIQYSPTFPSATASRASPPSTHAFRQQQFVYFGGIPPPNSYTLDYAYNANQPRRHSSTRSTRSAPKFTQQPFDIHVERL